MSASISSVDGDVISPTRRTFSVPRFFSFDSMQQCTTPTAIIYEQPQWEYSLKSKEFLLKIAQIIVAIICTGLYSEGIRLMDHSITTMMFPNVVFSAFIIITSVIAMSYVLGHVMADVLVRTFNSLGMVLYLVAACITGHYYLVVGQYKADESDDNSLKADMLLAETCMAFLNTLLYGIDVFLSLKRTFQLLDSPNHHDK